MRTGYTKGGSEQPMVVLAGERFCTLVFLLLCCSVCVPILLRLRICAGQLLLFRGALGIGPADERKPTSGYDGALGLVPAAEVAAVAIGAHLASLGIPAGAHLVAEQTLGPELAAANLVEVGAKLGPFGLSNLVFLAVHTHLPGCGRPHRRHATFAFAHTVGAGVVYHRLALGGGGRGRTAIATLAGVFVTIPVEADVRARLHCNGLSGKIILLLHKNKINFC